MPMSKCPHCDGEFEIVIQGVEHNGIHVRNVKKLIPEPDWCEIQIEHEHVETGDGTAEVRFL